MAEGIRYYFNGFVVIPDMESYLVVVEARNDLGARMNVADDLPAWMFESQLAIWITNEEAPIYQRSIEGDRFRKHLQSMRQKAS